MDHIGNLIPDKDKYLTAVVPNPTIAAPLPASPVASEMSTEVTLPPTESPEAELIRMTLYKIKDQVDILLHLLDLNPTPQDTDIPEHTRIVKGIFTGEKMQANSGEVFDVPTNYASKSKLVVGDGLKLTIPHTGSYIYKQITQVERKIIRGELVSGRNSGQWLVESNGKHYKVLTASVTFYKGRIADEVVLVVPSQNESEWGAIEHIIHR